MWGYGAYVISMVTAAAVMMAAEGTAMIEVVVALTAKMAVVTVMTGKAAADGNDGKSGGNDGDSGGGISEGTLVRK
jgi:hypothetical protein